MNAEKPTVHDFYRGDNWSAEESIGYLLRTTVSTLMRAAETAMRPYGLTSVQWAPLMIISRGGNPTAASLAMAPLTISVAVYMAYSNLTEFFDDVLRFLSLDLEGPSSKLSWQVVVHP